MEKFYNQEFYTAIMDEDVDHIEDLTNKYGSNFLIRVLDTAPGDLWKALAAIPLHLAAANTRVKSIQSLLSAGADPEIRDRLGRTALHLVISSWPHPLTAKHKLGSKLKTTGVHECSQAELCLQILCVHGININAEVEGGSRHTALHLSVHHRALSAVHILVSYGANINAVNSSGMTPLHMAAGVLHKDLIASLIEEGADVNMVCAAGGPALWEHSSAHGSSSICHEDC
ncbi:ankyrin repeat domain-containing protein 61-like isoform X2 [Takifugu flavidus]|uniref:ankyrin repeat domain-containing protein 61-like isoform X2 n=1 Tax=Takifugu flavidus TaxID=433684 RepID=UPI00254426BA|nr:ankyrin repeat domain-containing protein 61-like isoform X2 [Takifugu flavidus]